MQTYTWHTSKPADISAPGTVHQILAYGNLKSILGLKNALGKEQLEKIFLDHPQKVYTPSGLHFIVKFILHITSPINEARYLKTTPRYIG